MKKRDKSLKGKKEETKARRRRQRKPSPYHEKIEP
jgi:hypothetical protein